MDQYGCCKVLLVLKKCTSQIKAQPDSPVTKAMQIHPLYASCSGPWTGADTPLPLLQLSFCPSRFCTGNLNGHKNSEIVVDFRRSKPSHTSLCINDTAVDFVSTTKYLGLHITDNACHSIPQHCMHFLPYSCYSVIFVQSCPPGLQRFYLHGRILVILLLYPLFCTIYSVVFILVIYFLLLLS